MADERQEAVALPSLESEANVMKIVRDATFRRSVADRGLVLDLGRDMEIAFLQAGPNLVSVTDHEDSEGVALDPVLTETSRVRVPWPSAVDLAMNILREGVGKGSINVPRVLDAIRSFSNSEEEEVIGDAF